VLLVQHHTAAQVIGGLITLALAGAITIGVRRATVARLIVSRTGLKTRGMPARFGAALDWTEVPDLTVNPVFNDQLSRVVGELAAGLERQRERVRVTEQPTAGRDGRVDPDVDDGLTPILLAVSDNGSQMISRNTHTFMTLLAIAQHFGRPSTPTDQDRIAERDHQGRVATYSRSTTPRSCVWSSTPSRPNTTRSGSTRASATSPRTTNTKAAARRSAKPAATA